MYSTTALPIFLILAQATPTLRPLHQLSTGAEEV